ncbi:MAG TPA: 2Fe-2S iron-sulfur cluster-binding protein, partial [Longimicrobiales bacterium]|nr:2Fe-2S iron-sulfur cluster-binding protein [Longimicrobiales bacterium]
MRITVNGMATAAEAGASVAATLLNAGISAFRTSSGDETRAPLCGMGTCFECRVTIDGEAHRRSCIETVRDGMDVRTDANTVAADVASIRAAVGEARVAESGAGVVDADVAVIGAGPAGIAAAVTAA